MINRNLWVLCLYILLGTGVYWNSFGNSFQYDDQHIVEMNENIRTLKNIPEFFINPRTYEANPYEGGHYRPFVVTSYAINYALGGLDPAGYHVVNLAFHIGSAFLIFLVLKAMLGGSLAVSSQQSGVRSDSAGFFASIAAGLIFLVHPFNSEAVNYITARSSLMSGFFYLLAFYSWMRSYSPSLEKEGKGGFEQGSSDEKSKVSGRTFYIISLFAFVAGMLSKEVVITLPLVLWLYDLYFGEDSLRPAGVGASALRARRPVFRRLLDWRAYIPYLPFVLIVVVPYFIIRASSFGEALPHFRRDLWTQMFTGFPVLVQHWQMFLVPAPLTPARAVKIYSTFWSFPVIYTTLILVLYTVIALSLLRVSFVSGRVVSFFMFWFFVVIIPTTVIPLNVIFQENRGYLAMVSFGVLAGAAIGEVGKTRIQKAGIVLLVLLIAVYSVVVFQRNRVWKDELSLWSDTVQKAPLSPEGYTALGVAYQRHGMYNEAFEAFRKALILGGEKNFVVHDTLARIYMIQKKWDMAAQEFEKALHAFSYKFQTHHDLAVAYFRLNRLELSEKHFKEAARLDPRQYKPYYNLGIIYTKKGMLADALQAYQKALSLNPGDLESHFNLGTLLEALNRGGEAAEHYRVIVRQARKGEEELSGEAGRRLEQLGK